MSVSDEEAHHRTHLTWWFSLQQTSFKNTPYITLSKLPWQVNQTWEVMLRLPSWLFAFFSISRGLYLCLKLRLHAYFEMKVRNQLILQTSFFRQALGRSDLIENRVEAGQLVIIYFWPNLEHREQQGIIHIPVEGILGTTASNTPKQDQDSPTDYCTISPPPPHLGRYHIASARNSTPSESSDETEVSGVSQTESQVQQEVDLWHNTW